MGNSLPSPRPVPKRYRLGSYQLPQSACIEQLPEVKLPDDRAAFPYLASTPAPGFG